jgi:hypothetical protein
VDCFLFDHGSVFGIGVLFCGFPSDASIDAIKYPVSSTIWKVDVLRIRFLTLRWTTLYFIPQFLSGLMTNVVTAFVLHLIHGNILFAIGLVCYAIACILGAHQINIQCGLCCPYSQVPSPRRHRD